VSFMGRSIGAPEKVPAGRVNDAASGSVIRVELRNGKMFHSLSEDGLSAEYEIRYRIGAGKVGYSYAAEVGDSLLQSPVSYFKKYGWDVSPGFAGKELLDFDRVLSGRCLFCHSDARSSSSEKELKAISCERCHGDTAEHVKRPTAENIVNPSRLAVRARDSVCEQCHLEGVARVVNPRKTLYDFKPGMDLEASMAIYVVKQPMADVRAVSQEEQLATSECSKGSGGRLWCGTCHNPHEAAKNRSSEIKAICTGCHPRLSAAQHAGVTECTSCHMPQRAPSDVAHAALTDHRILAKPGISAAVALAGGLEIRVWRAPPADCEQRDLGLGYVEAGSNSGDERLSEAGSKILESLPASESRDDAAVNAALGDIELARGRAAEAAALFRRASELDASSGRFAMLLGVSLEKSDTEGAMKELRRAMQLDRSLERAYLELAALYQMDGKPREAQEVLSEYLKWNPQSVLGRLTERTLTGVKKR